VSRRRVAPGRAARERRYESAVRRQIALIDGAVLAGLSGWRYAPAEEFLRAEDDLVMFTEDGQR
jgi:hypothetical protein